MEHVEHFLHTMPWSHDQFAVMQIRIVMNDILHTRALKQVLDTPGIKNGISASQVDSYMLGIMMFRDVVANKYVCRPVKVAHEQVGIAKFTCHKVPEHELDERLRWLVQEAITNMRFPQLETHRVNKDRASNQRRPRPQEPRMHDGAHAVREHMNLALVELMQLKNTANDIRCLLMLPWSQKTRREELVRDPRL